MAGTAGFTSVPEPIDGDKVRGKPEKFAEHYQQATLFWKRQSDVERRHIAKAFRFELGKVQTIGVRERVVATLRNVAEELAAEVAKGLGMAALPDPIPRAMLRPPKAEVTHSSSLSLLARPGEEGIRTRRVAILVAEGVDAEAATRIHADLTSRGAMPRYVGIQLGTLTSVDGATMDVESPLEGGPSVLWDAVAVPGGAESTSALAASGQALEFLRDQFRHCKTMLLLDDASGLLERAGIPNVGPGVLIGEGRATDHAIADFVDALLKHRHYERETDPPAV